MKRLNPDTGKPFVRGDTRADGFLFSHYVLNYIKKDGYFRERWRSPKSFKNQNYIQQKWKLKNPNYNNLWWQKHLDKRAAKRAKRRAAKLNRTPPWLTKEHLQEIKSVYAESKRLTIETGVVHHVDHIVPLQGETVSGLHVPWNLRVIPQHENLEKSNKLISTT